MGVRLLTTLKMNALGGGRNLMLNRDPINPKTRSLILGHGRKAKAQLEFSHLGAKTEIAKAQRGEPSPWLTRKGGTGKLVTGNGQGGMT